MARCCGGGSPGIKIEAGRKIAVTGTGTSQDPFVIAADLALSVEDSETFELGLAGDGTLESPWVLRVGYAPGASINDLPDVDAALATDAQVLGWSVSQQKWTPHAPTMAAPGLINSDNTIDGDGSVGAPLAVHPDTTRYLSINASGVGLNNAGINALVRVFPDAATRAAASPAPAVNTVSLLASAPGQIDYWDGAAWQPISNGIGVDVQPGQMLALSGPYAGGKVTNYVSQVSSSTDAGGVFEVIPAADLSGYAGVLAVRLDPVGLIADTPWVPMLHTDADRIICTAYRADDGTPYAFATVLATVTALLY